VYSPWTAQHRAAELEDAMRDCAGLIEKKKKGAGWKSESLEALAHKAIVSGQRGGRVPRGSEAAPLTAALSDKDKVDELLRALHRPCAAVDEKAAREAAAEVFLEVPRVSVKAAGEEEIRKGFERLDCLASKSALSAPQHKSAVPKLNFNALVGGQKVSPATSSTANSAGASSMKHRSGDWLAPELSDERIFSSKARLKSPSLRGPVSPDAPASSTLMDDNPESFCRNEPFLRAPSDGSTASEGSEPPAPIAIVYSHRPTVLQRAAQLDDEIGKRPLPWELHAVGATQAAGAHWKSESLDALARKALVSGNGQKANITPRVSTPSNSRFENDAGPEFTLRSSVCGCDQASDPIPVYKTSPVTDVDRLAPCEVVLPLGASQEGDCCEEGECCDQHSLCAAGFVRINPVTDNLKKGQESAGNTAPLSNGAGSRTGAASSPIWKHNATPRLPGIMSLMEGNSLRYLVSGDKRRTKVDPRKPKKIFFNFCFFGTPYQGREANFLFLSLFIALSAYAP
jgi:hypothetical protein